jgi:hypothetical protein
MKTRNPGPPAKTHRSERETLLIFNQDDLDRGFFRFGTSQKSAFDRLCRRVGGIERLIDVTFSRNKKGETTWWEAHVPVKYLSGAHFGVRKHSSLTSRSSRGRKSNK